MLGVSYLLGVGLATRAIIFRFHGWMGGALAVMAGCE